jgi:hypothetical protein
LPLPDRSSRSTVINPYTIALKRGLAPANKAGEQHYKSVHKYPDILFLPSRIGLILKGHETE